MRIGIYAGTFDPVHTGHITLALQAIDAAWLDEVVFLPERMPRRKHPTEHYAHRLAMIKRAIKPHPSMSVLELVDKSFTVRRTWLQLQTLFPNSELVLILGSDILTHLTSWPLADKLLAESEILVGARNHDDPAMIRLFAESWQQQPKQLHIVQSYSPEVSSTKIRRALTRRERTHGLLMSVRRYAQSNWLYISVDYAISKKN